MLRIYRPGFLKCDRKEPRLAETILGWTMPLADLLSGNRTSIATDDLANVMVKDALKDLEGEDQLKVAIYSNSAIRGRA